MLRWSGLRELRLAVAGRSRFGSRLDDHVDADAPALDALLALPRPESRRLLLVGGEPTLRRDLPALLQGLGHPAPGLRSDALLPVKALNGLHAAGLRWLRVPFYSSEPGAHDWLVGRAGAGRATLRALRELRGSPLDLEVELVLTRPTLSQLPRSLDLLARLGLRRVRIRPLQARGAARAQAVALVPRLGLCTPVLESCLGLGLDLHLEGFVGCLLGRARSLLEPPGERGQLAPPGLDGLLPSPTRPGCAGCDCGGWPEDYLEVFGDSELRPEAAGPAILALEPTASTRRMRKELVRLAGSASRLHVAPFDHPDALALLRESLRLGFTEVSAAGDGACLLRHGPGELKSLRNLAAIAVREEVTLRALLDAGLPATRVTDQGDA